MKSLINPWIIIRWAFVAALFAGTLAISVDVVKTRDEAIAVLESAVSTSKDEQRKSSEELGKVRVKLATALADLKQLDVLTKDLNETREIIDKLAAHNPVFNNYVETEGAVTPQRAVVRPYALAPPPPIPIEVPGEAPPPPWYPLAPSVVTKRIKDDAIREWKDNYTMVNHEIKRQSEAYNELLAYYKTANPVVKELLAKAAASSGNNYTQVAYEVKRQLEAKKELDGR
jgi:TRAP-type mannitol/chloroaromatic compound transport system substrate-binding protein